MQNKIKMQRHGQPAVVVTGGRACAREGGAPPTACLRLELLQGVVELGWGALQLHPRLWREGG